MSIFHKTFFLIWKKNKKAQKRHTINILNNKVNIIKQVKAEAKEINNNH